LVNLSALEKPGNTEELINCETNITIYIKPERKAGRTPIAIDRRHQPELISTDD
jgi:hypothetical protein